MGIPDKSQTNAGLNNLRDALRRGEWKSCEKPLFEISNELVALSGRGEVLSKERNAFVSSMKVLLESSSVSSSSKTFFQCAGHLLMKLQSPAYVLSFRRFTIFSSHKIRKKKNRYDEETRTWIESLSDDIDVDRFVDALSFVARHIVIIRVESMNHLIRTSMFISPPLHTHVLTR